MITKVQKEKLALWLAYKCYCQSQGVAEGNFTHLARFMDRRTDYVKSRQV